MNRERMARLIGELWGLVDDVHVAIAFNRDGDAPLDRLERSMAELEHEIAGETHARIDALTELCVCGRDRGEHLVGAPHPSDEDEEPCGLEPCAGYRARTTEPYLPRFEPATEPPPPPTAEAS